MKKIIFIIALFVLAVGCRVTKTMEMYRAKSNQKLTEQQFLDLKENAVSILKLTDSQLGEAKKIWKEEKAGLNRINIEDNSMIAPVVYKSEIEFRKILNTQQLSDYKTYVNDLGGKTKIPAMFLSDHALSELKRIYDLKE